MYDVVVVGAGLAGMATALRLQAQGFRTLVCEAHRQPGGCAGFYRRHGFAFDVGATTLVDFEAGGVGAALLADAGMAPLSGEALPGYTAWLPDRTVVLHRDPAAWAAERLRAFGATADHHAFWRLLDRLAAAFWAASSNGVRLPLRNLSDIIHNAQALGLPNLPLVRYLGWTMGAALRHFRLRDDPALVGLLGMLIEDTVHSTVDQAPLINAALGCSIRGAGLTRHAGGMYGFWRAVVAHYRSCGGELRTSCPVAGISGQAGNFVVHTSAGPLQAAQVVCALPAALTARIAPPAVGAALQPYLERDAADRGGAIMVCLGVPESEVAGQPMTHHQLLQEYGQPLGNGNNMFISVSAPGDLESAPAGYRAVMVSTHCELAEWQDLTPAEYAEHKQQIGARLLGFARRVYPNLGANPWVYDVGTPRTYARFTGRPDGAVSGVRQRLGNSNQRAISHHTSLRGFWLAGDSTWPGLGTVACALGSRIVAEGVVRVAGRSGQRRNQ